MLRLFHTADWHLGHCLHGVSRQLEHQRFLDWLLLELQSKQADALIVAGDILIQPIPQPPPRLNYMSFWLKPEHSYPL